MRDHHDLTPDPALAETDAEKLLLEWYQQWWDRDDMPNKMGDALHVRTAMYWTQKQATHTTTTITEPPGHHIDVVHGGMASTLICQCGWRGPFTETASDNDINTSKQLHWLAKKIEREALDKAMRGAP